MGTEGARNEDAFLIGEPAPTGGTAGIVFEGEQKLEFGEVGKAAEVARETLIEGCNHLVTDEFVHHPLFIAQPFQTLPQKRPYIILL